MPSSVVTAIRYDVITSTLRVIYVSGSVYDYKQVPEKIYKDMRAASSKGEFLNKHIKPNYEFEKIKWWVSRKNHRRYTIEEDGELLFQT